LWPRRTPLRVWLNRSMFPLDLISISPRLGNHLREVQVSFGFADNLLKLRSGDGVDYSSLTPSQSIDLFVHRGAATNLDLPSLPRAHLLSVGSGQPLVVSVSWLTMDREAAKEEMCLVWADEDRRKGLRPRIAFGQNAALLREFTNDPSEGINGKLLQLHARVPEMRLRDARSREKTEARGRSMSSEQNQSSRVALISVSGFRGFRQEAVLQLAMPNGQEGGGLTIAVGANNTGKSTVWESFDAVARKLKSDVSFSEGRRNRHSPDGVRIQATWADGCGFVVASQNVNTSETTGIWLGEHEHTSIEIVSVRSRRQFQPSFSKHANSQRDWMIGAQDFSRQRQPDDGFTGRLFDLHSNPAKKLQFDELMEEVIGHPFNWSIDLGEGQHGQSHYLKVNTGESVDHTSEGLGDGIISLLFILNALYDSEPETLLVFDEPELSLHPQLVKRLGRVFARYSKDRQIVVFTHSPLLVSWDDVAAGAEIARVFKKGPDSRIAQVPRATIEELAKARGGWRNPHVLGQDATEALFLDDDIIVVEGQDDAGLLPRVFEQVGVPAHGTVFGWGAGGGDGNPRRIVSLLRGLGFEKVVTLLDADKAEEAKAIDAEFPEYFATTIPADDIRDKPANNSKGKSGLLDDRGMQVNEEFIGATREVLERVSNYFHEPRDGATKVHEIGGG
jgi:energy-coupling factor transporter ATP-binding protein EcfA2